MGKFKTSTVAAGLTLAVLLGTAFYQAPVQAQSANSARRDANLSEAFFAANQLRATGQRVARLYLESGTNVRPNKTRQLLEQEVKAYDQLIAELKRQKQDATLQKHLGKVEESWAELKPMVTARFSLDKAELAYSISEQLYIQTSKATSLLETQAESETGYLSDVAGRNAAFAERIAKAAFLFALTKKSGSLVDFETWKKEYIDGYERLETSNLNDDYAKGNLKLGRMMWSLFDDVLSNMIKKSDTSRMLDVAKSVDGMWDIAQSSKKQYEAMFRQQLKQGNQVASQPARKGS